MNVSAELLLFDTLPFYQQVQALRRYHTTRHTRHGLGWVKTLKPSIVVITIFFLRLPNLIRTTVLVGMHGSGLTNALYLQRGAVLLQIMPFKTGPCVVGVVLCAVVRACVRASACASCRAVPCRACRYLTNNHYLPCRLVHLQVVAQRPTRASRTVRALSTRSPPLFTIGRTKHTLHSSPLPARTKNATGVDQSVSGMHGDALGHSQ